VIERAYVLFVRNATAKSQIKSAQYAILFIPDIVMEEKAMSVVLVIPNIDKHTIFYMQQNIEQRKRI
jgi:hypothetical protein